MKERQVFAIACPTPNRPIRPISLTFAAHGGLRPTLLGKTFFSTRRPALEAGGQRPTARCALGRESVWFGVVTEAGDDFSPSPRTSRGEVKKDCGIVRQSVGKAWRHS